MCPPAGTTPILAKRMAGQVLAKRMAGQAINPRFVVFSVQETASLGDGCNSFGNRESALLQKLGEYARPARRAREGLAGLRSRLGRGSPA